LAATVHIHHLHCYYYSARRLILILPSHKSVFSLVPWLSTGHCPHLLLSTVAYTVDRYLLPAGAQQQTRRMPLLLSIAPCISRSWLRYTAQTSMDCRLYTQGDSDVALFHIYGSWFSPPSCRYNSENMSVTVIALKCGDWKCET